MLSPNAKQPWLEEVSEDGLLVVLVCEERFDSAGICIIEVSATEGR